MDILAGLPKKRRKMNNSNLPEIHVLVFKNNFEKTDIKVVVPYHLPRDIGDYHGEEAAKDTWWEVYKQIEEEFKKK